MKIEHFIAQSIGEWRSMRSGHSLAFQKFEDVTSQLVIETLSSNNNEVLKLLESNPTPETKPVCPFKISWKADSNWESSDESEVSSGSSIFVPIPTSNIDGLMLRSKGYAEAGESICKYNFLSCETLCLITKYEHSIAEERIWFASKHVRCRSSIIRTSNSKGILQTSFASEVRRLK